ncbi:hypothetical protein [Streptomyces sp. NBC_01089]|uniref:LexA family protein n=1 Tax=Streptomyces sp. NBC_01089 TaxID=2903747 RepID=UPI0038653AD8
MDTDRDYPGRTDGAPCGRQESGRREHDGITDRQARVPRFLRDAVAEFGRRPTMREIGDAVVLSSTSSVNYQLRRSAALGLVPRITEGWQPYG